MLKNKKVKKNNCNDNNNIQNGYINKNKNSKGGIRDGKFKITSCFLTVRRNIHCNLFNLSFRENEVDAITIENIAVLA